MTPNRIRFSSFRSFVFASHELQTSRQHPSECGSDAHQLASTLPSSVRPLCIVSCAQHAIRRRTCPRMTSTLAVLFSKFQIVLKFCMSELHRRRLTVSALSVAFSSKLSSQRSTNRAACGSGSCVDCKAVCKCCRTSRNIDCKGCALDVFRPTSSALQTNHVRISTRKLVQSR